MNKADVTNLFKAFKTGVTKHSPEILTGIGIAGMLTTTVLAVKATPKALQKIEEAEIEKAKENPQKPDGVDYSECRDITLREKLTPVEVIKVTWKCYIPAVVTATAATACLIGGTRVSARRNAALATAYQLSTTAFNEYKEKVVETIGEKKEKAVHEKIAKDHVEKNPVSTKEVYFTGSGETLCFDITSGRYFNASKDVIMRAMNDLNYQMSTGMEMYISLNEFYDEIGLPHIPLGDELGWTVGKGLIDISFSAQLTDKDQPCMVIEHLVPPEYGFNKLY